MRTEHVELTIDYSKSETAVQPETPAFFDAWLLDCCMDKPELETRKPLVIVVPGGGYHFVSRREGDPVAAKYLAAGCSVIVLNYSVKDEPFPTALLELAETVRTAREKSEEWGIDPDRIFLIGFSAGGHLAASLATLWNKGFLGKALGCEDKELRPDGLILGYPVITPKEYRGVGETCVLNRCFERILKSLPEQYWELNALELQADAGTPPAFIFSTWQDRTVPIEQSLIFADALRKAGVDVEIHIFRRGRHGLTTVDDTVIRDETDFVPAFREWIPLSIAWMKDLSSGR